MHAAGLAGGGFEAGLSSMRKVRTAAMLIVAALLAGCGGPAPVKFIADGQPAKLSDWHVLRIEDGKLRLNEGVSPYDLNTPLFSDYAHKLRTIWMPKGASAKYSADSPWGIQIVRSLCA